MPAKEAKAKKQNKPRNHQLTKGLHHFSRSRIFKKHAVYKKKRVKTPKKVVKKPESVIVKSVGGEKNGKERKVPVVRRPRLYDTDHRPRRLQSNKKPFNKHKHHLRSSITPGTVLILVAGRHRGKRVVFLKQLASGLLLVTGPHALNGCPLRRINQIYVIATKTKVDISGINLPDHLNDKYFNRPHAKKSKADEKDIFETKKDKYQVSEQRKADQKTVDKLMIDAIKKHQDKKLLFAYLKGMFSLKNNDLPHKMVF